MGSWIAAIGAFVAASAAMVGMGAHHVPPHNPALSGYSTPSPTPGMGMSMPGGGDTPGGSTGSAERTQVPLQAMPTGTVTLGVDSRTGRVAARLDMFGLTPGTQHRVALYEGQGGEVAFSFPDATANGEGQLQETELSYEWAPQGLPGDPSFQIDLLPTQPGGIGASQVIAVAGRAIPPGDRAQVALPFTSQISKSGNALLAYDPASRKLTVSLQISRLVPWSDHAAHIRTGSCQDQGPVLLPLPDLVANGRGDASEQTTLTVSSPPPATGWFVDIQDGTVRTVLLPNGQPGALFQPLVCGNVRPGPTL